MEPSEESLRARLTELVERWDAEVERAFAQSDARVDEPAAQALYIGLARAFGECIVELCRELGIPVPGDPEGKP